MIIKRPGVQGRLWLAAMLVGTSLIIPIDLQAQDCNFDPEGPRGPVSIVSEHVVAGGGVHRLLDDGSWFPAALRRIDGGRDGVLIGPVLPPYAEFEWARLVMHPYARSVHPVALDLDEAGNIYLLGRSLFDHDGSEPLLMRMSPEGDSIWAVDYRPSAAEGFVPGAMAISPHSSITVVGGQGEFGLRPAVLRFSLDGILRWAAVEDERGYAVDLVIDDRGRSFVASNILRENASIALVTAYAPDGRVLWRHEHEGRFGRGQPNRIRLSPDGGVVIGGVQSDGEYLDFLLYKLDADGRLAWQRTYDRASGDDYLVDLRISENGDVFALGHSSAGRGYRWVVQRHGVDGELQWSRLVDADPACGRQFLARGLFLDGEGGVYVVGSAENTSMTLKEELAVLRLTGEGSVAWSVQTETFGYTRGIGEVTLARTTAGQVLIAYNLLEQPFDMVGRLVVLEDGYVSTSSEIAESPAERVPAISVYPNPAASRLNIEVDRADTAQIRVADVLGRHMHARVVDSGHGRMVLDVSDLPAGGYFLVIGGRSGERVVPFSVVR